PDPENRLASSSTLAGHERKIIEEALRASRGRVYGPLGWRRDLASRVRRSSRKFTLSGSTRTAFAGASQPVIRSPPSGISSIDEIPDNQEFTNVFRFINMRWPGDCAVGRRQMLKIQRRANGDVVLILSGRLRADNVGELSAVLEGETSGRRVVL